MEYLSVYKLLSGLLLFFLLCGTAGATDLFITVRDSVDDAPIPAASVYMNGSDMGQTTASGTFLLSHTSDVDFDLKIIKNGYEEWDSIVSANTTDLFVNMTGRTRLLTVQLYDADTLAPVPDATVIIAFNTSGDTRNTDTNGTAIFPVNQDTAYSITVSAPQYQSPAIRTIEISSSGKTVQYWLVRIDRFSIVVTDSQKNTVPGAAIFLNDKPAGTTDSRGVLILQVRRDVPYTIKATKYGFQEFTESKTFGENEAVHRIVMTKMSGNSSVSVYDQSRNPVEGAEVYLDGAFTGYSDMQGNVSLDNIRPGSYQLEVRKAGYNIVRKTVLMTGSGDRISSELPPDLASLTIFTRDREQVAVSGAHIFVNEADLGTSDASGRITTNVEYDVPTRITAQKEGFQTTTIVTTVIAGNSTSTTILVLDRTMDWGFIAVIILAAACVLSILIWIMYNRRKPSRHIVRRNEI